MGGREGGAAGCERERSRVTLVIIYQKKINFNSKQRMFSFLFFGSNIAVANGLGSH